MRYLVFCVVFCSVIFYTYGEDYYSQKIIISGITVKASRSVDPEALVEASKIIELMLKNPQVLKRMVDAKVEIAIIPKNSFMTELPEYARYRGQKDFNGEYPRGSGWAHDYYSDEKKEWILKPVAAIPEENLFRNNESKLDSPSLINDPYRCEDVGVHEFAHTIMEFGLDEQALERLKIIYASAKARNLWPEKYAMKNYGEFFAEMTQSYFEVNNEISYKDIRRQDPKAYIFLKDVYGDFFRKK